MCPGPGPQGVPPPTIPTSAPRGKKRLGSRRPGCGVCSGPPATRTASFPGARQSAALPPPAWREARLPTAPELQSQPESPGPTTEGDRAVTLFTDYLDNPAGVQGTSLAGTLQTSPVSQSREPGLRGTAHGNYERGQKAAAQLNPPGQHPRDHRPGGSWRHRTGTALKPHRAQKSHAALAAGPGAPWVWLADPSEVPSSVPGGRDGGKTEEPPPSKVHEGRGRGGQSCRHRGLCHADQTRAPSWTEAAARVGRSPCGPEDGPAGMSGGAGTLSSPSFSEGRTWGPGRGTPGRQTPTRGGPLAILQWTGEVGGQGNRHDLYIYDTKPERSRPPFRKSPDQGKGRAAVGVWHGSPARPGGCGEHRCQAPGQSRARLRPTSGLRRVGTRAGRAPGQQTPSAADRLSASPCSEKRAAPGPAPLLGLNWPPQGPGGGSPGPTPLRARVPLCLHLTQALLLSVHTPTQAGLKEGACEARPSSQGRAPDPFSSPRPRGGSIPPRD